MFCHRCGSQAASTDSFCPNCGTSLTPEAHLSSGQDWAAPAGVHSRTGAWIGEGWEMVKDDLSIYAGLALVTILLGSMVPFVIQGPLTAGFFIFCMNQTLGRRAEFGDLFAGFNYFIPALLASLVIGLLVAAGTICCIIPGIMAAASCKFAYLFIVDKRMDFWSAIKASHAVVRQDYFGFCMFLVVMTLVNVLGLLCCVVGLLVTLPISIAAVTVAYRDIVGFEPTPAPAP
ncbi:MAG TPA: zinc-ribbon domain-containing protein [Bryobacteraceae bacterium]|nr:zinc-ribbon domain-containing protein [Bryobacteraceae bacterium]